MTHFIPADAFMTVGKMFAIELGWSGRGDSVAFRWISKSTELPDYVSPSPYDNPEPGLYFDGAGGADFIDKLVISLATNYGWTGDDGNYGEDNEFLSEVADEAIDYLNTLETREGYSWAYENGDFGLWDEQEQ